MIFTNKHFFGHLMSACLIFWATHVQYTQVECNILKTMVMLLFKVLKMRFPTIS